MDLYKKKRGSGSAEDIERRYGKAWIWTTIDTPTRLLITYWIGGFGMHIWHVFLKGYLSECSFKYRDFGQRSISLLWNLF